MGLIEERSVYTDIGVLLKPFVFGIPSQELWNLLSVQEILAGPLVDLVRCIEQVSSFAEWQHLYTPQGSATIDEENRKQLIQILDSTTPILHALGLQVSLGVLSNLHAILQSPTCVVSDVGIEARSFLTSLSSEMKTRVFILTNADDKELVNPLERFGSEVIARFPTLNYDMEEAVKCLFFERYTASIFHIARLMESVIRQWADSVGVATTKLTPSMRLRDEHWANIEPLIRKEVEALPESTQVEKDKRLGQLQALKTFGDFRDAWRNQTAHPDAHFTRHEAEDVLNSATIFLRRLVAVL